MAMVKHCAWLSRGEFKDSLVSCENFSVSGLKRWVTKNISTTLTRHHRQFAGFRHPVIAVGFVVRVGMIDTMKMNSVREVMRVFEDHLHGVSLLDTNHR